MARWRVARGWSDAELWAVLDELARSPVNFDEAPERMTRENGWRVDGVYDVPMGSERPGPPAEGGVFARARGAVLNYDFSDPAIVVGHFDPETPVDGRTMLLEMKAGGLHFLNGCRVHSAEDASDETGTSFCFRYDTLRGHVERGSERFELRKDHETGGVTFTIEARWRLGDFPTFWSKLGFELVGKHFRRLWRRRAARRLRDLCRETKTRPIATPGGLAHRGDAVPRRTASPADATHSRPATLNPKGRTDHERRA